jgi:glycosyltransferase involved in cell wall biosynthesis
MAEPSALKVLLIGDYPPPMGGVSVHVRQLQQFLVGRGVKARVLDIGKGGRPAPEVLPAQTPLHFLQEVSRHAAQGYALHLHTNGANLKSWLLTLATAAAARAQRASCTVTVHSGSAPSYLRGGAARRRLAKLALSGCPRVVAVSDAVAEALCEAGLPRSHVYVLPPFLGSQLRPGVPPPAALAARSQFRLLLACALHPSPLYGHRTLLEMLALARDLELGAVVFGPGTDGPEFRALVADVGLSARVVGLGEVDAATAQAVIAQSDVFVRPTLVDGDSISVREALGLGVRCVASDVVLRPANVLTFRSGDAAHLLRQVHASLAAPAVTVRSPDAGPRLLEIYREARGGRDARDG